MCAGLKFTQSTVPLPRGTRISVSPCIVQCVCGSGGAGVRGPAPEGDKDQCFAMRGTPLLGLELGCACVCVDPVGLESVDPLPRGTRTSVLSCRVQCECGSGGAG